MRVLLDECVDRRFARDLPGHDVRMSPEMGWAGLQNGELLRRAEAHFDALVTVDRRLPSQQNLSSLSIPVIILRVPSNRLEDLRPLAAAVLAALGRAKRGEATWVGGENAADHESAGPRCWTSSQKPRGSTMGIVVLSATSRRS